MFTDVARTRYNAGWQIIPGVDYSLAEKELPDIQSGSRLGQLSVVSSQGVRCGC